MEQTNELMIEQRQSFIKIRDAGHLVGWAAPGKSSCPEQNCIREMLNRYELLAIGVRTGALDAKFYRRWLRTTTVEDWIALKPFVTELRQQKKRNTFFCEFETLAKKWALNSENEHV